MKILQGGAPKCGNFWFYRIIEEILQHSGQKAPGYIERQKIYPVAKEWKLNFPGQAKIDVLDVTDLQYSYRISSIFRMPVDDIAEYVSHTNHVWTHSPVCKRSAELFHLFDKKVYIIRDPRDRAVSAAKYYCSDYMRKYFPQAITDPEVFLEKHFEDLMREWVWHVFDHLRLSRRFHIQIVFFENFLFNFSDELQQLLNYLEIYLKDSQQQAIEYAVNFQNLKKQNPDHLNKGKAGYWREVLSDEQIEKTQMIAGALLSALHYPADKASSEDYAPANTIQDFELLKQKLFMSQAQVV